MRITDTTVALVTGGASGLGGATVRRLVADGAKAVVLDLQRGRRTTGKTIKKGKKI